MAAPRFPDRARVQDRICAALAGGATMRCVLAQPGMPDAKSISNWARAEPEFRRRMDEARSIARAARAATGGPVRWDPLVAAQIVERVRAGETIPDLMNATGVHRRALNGWKTHSPAFAAELASACRAAEEARRRGPRQLDRTVADRAVQLMNAGAGRPELTAAGVPSKRVLRRWRREALELDQALKLARKGGARRRGRARCLLTPELTETICEAIRLGASLNSLGRRDDMPCAATLYGWLRKRPDFEQAVAEACRDRADFLLDAACAAADAATPANAGAMGARIGALKSQWAIGERWWRTRNAP